MRMATIDPSEYLSGRLNEQIDYHDRKAASSQRAYRRLVTISVVSASLTPLLLAFELLYSPPRLDNPIQLAVVIVPIVVATITAISTVWLSAFKYKESWVEHRLACEALRREETLFKFRAAPYAGAADPCALLVERAEAVMDGDTGTWRSSLENGSDATKDVS